MKKSLSLSFALMLVSPAWGHGVPVGALDDSMPDVQKIRFCERVRDHALQAFYNRERGQAMKLFEEDGSKGPAITNQIIRHIYAEPQISSPKKAEVYGRGRCNELMGTSSSID
jgi:hypothetical protein